MSDSPTLLALEYLLQEQQLGYPEAQHALTFPLPGPLGVRFENHNTVFFQRLIILDVLLDVRKASFSINPNVIEEEVQRIIAAKHRHLGGGWSYFPQLEYFPPDTDDLGAVLHVASAIDSCELKHICNQAIETVFINALQENGAVDTWILDKNCEPEAIQKVKNCIEIIGGKGVHTEVVANFFEALIRYDHETYKTEIGQGAKYLETIQQADGFWPSKWYWGNFYGTLKAMNVIHYSSKNNNSITKACNYFVAKQHQNGAWGTGSGDPLNTAFGILALCQFQKKSAYNKAILNAIQYLYSTQAIDGSWESVPFIKMESLSGLLSYGSRTITTAFALKAILRHSLQ